MIVDTDPFGEDETDMARQLRLMEEAIKAWKCDVWAPQSMVQCELESGHEGAHEARVSEFTKAVWPHRDDELER